MSLVQASSWAETSGRLRLQETSFFKKQKPPVRSSQESVTLEIEGKWSLSKSMRLRLEPKARYNSDPNIVDAPLDGDLHDTGVETKLGSVRLHVGSFVRVWEGTDGLNPMDVASMKNSRDPLGGESLSSVGLALSGGQNFFTWDVLYIPRQTRTRLPGPTSPWFPRSNNLPLQRDDRSLLIPDEPEYQLLSRQEIAKALDQNGGVRLQLHGESWDFSLGGFQGASQTPLLLPEVNADLVDVKPDGSLILRAKNPIGIRPVDYPRRSVSGALVYTRESWILRLAARHDQPFGGDQSPASWVAANLQASFTTQSLLPTWSSLGILGLEKTVGIGTQNVVFILQGSYGVSPESGGVISAQDLLRRALMAGFRWPLSDETTVSFMGFYENKWKSSYSRLLFQKKITDPALIEASIDLFRGPPQSILGIWSDQSSGSLAFIYQF